MNIIAALFAVLIGAAFCFFGYRVFLVMLPVWGFFAGFWLGAQMINLLLGDGFLATTTGWVVGFIAGLITAILSYLFYVIGVMIIGAGFGAALGAGVLSIFGVYSGLVYTLVVIISAILVAILTLILNLQKFVVIAITALVGTNAMIFGILLLLNRVTLDSVTRLGNTIRPITQESPIWLLAWIALAVLGFAVQLRASRDYRFKKEQYYEAWG